MTGGSLFELIGLILHLFNLPSGPLTYKDTDETYTLIGLVSFGPWGCYDDYYPTVYARVTSVMDWIRSYVKGDDEKCPPK